MRDVGSADATARAAIPDAALLIKDFVNTVDRAAQTETFTSAPALRAWLEAHDLAHQAKPLTEDDLTRARAVREGLRQLLLVNAGHAPDVGALERFNSVLGATAVTVRFDATGRRLLDAAESAPLDAAIAALLAAVDELRAAHVWERLKVCARDECRWAYYDASRNRSGRWCSMTDCGNRVKMRRAYAARTHGSDA
ncbi:CGNR zinc finger domain-containing protein [Cellulomonas sp. URHE0023]|uniref:CGNR zinc finger domain-containing protein n=1 Tax=Cellulomonas sp. URHE0023 TaxID=1380354 RepID=UPI00068B26F2|nr:CGNR zinc finger domain-containing protein [Cellulomonas sp. URHE0023]